MVRDGMRFWEENQKKYDCEHLQSTLPTARIHHQSHTNKDDNNADDDSSYHTESAISRMLSCLGMNDQCHQLNKDKLVELEKQCFSILKTLEGNQDSESLNLNSEKSDFETTSSCLPTDKDSIITQEKLRILGINKKTTINTNIDHIMKCDHIPYSSQVANMREDIIHRPLWK